MLNRSCVKGMQLPLEYQVTCGEKTEEAKWARSEQKGQQFVQHVSAAPAVRSGRSAFAATPCTSNLSQY